MSTITKPLVVTIEGNIGSGKSTLLKNMKEKYKNNTNFIFVDEPVADWDQIRDENGTTMLSLFYADSEKHAFSFQMMAFLSRFARLKEAIEKNPDAIIITERSLFTDHYVFAKMLFDSGKISYVNYLIYKTWFNTFVKDCPVHKIIYVNTPPEICYQRIQTRSRDGESNIPLEYLKSCHDYHTRMISLESCDCICESQITLNGKDDIYKNKDILNEWLTQMNVFINAK